MRPVRECLEATRLDLICWVGHHGVNNGASADRAGAAEHRHRTGASSDEMSILIDWAEIDRNFGGIYAAAKGELGWPPLALFKALLLATWHDLSDVKLADAIEDRASFRRFCGFAAFEPTPERTGFVRFRAELTTGASVRSPNRVSRASPGRTISRPRRSPR